MDFSWQWPPTRWHGGNGKKHAAGSPLLSETDFHAALRLERLRTERGNRPFLMMLAAFEEPPAAQKDREMLLVRLGCALAASCRETDIFGWDRQAQALGAVFTELGRNEQLSAEQKNAAVNSLHRKAAAILDRLTESECPGRPSISFYFFPEEAHGEELSARWSRSEHRHAGNSRN